MLFRSYSDDTLLLKMEEGYRGKLTKNLQKCGIESMELFLATDEGDWYRATLSGEFDIATAIGKTRSLDEVKTADYDYVIRTAEIDTDIPVIDGEGKDDDPDDGNNGHGNDKDKESYECIDDVKDNALWKDQWYLNSCELQKAWKFLQANGISAGGLSTVVVAVIDTGVDYTHPDLIANMWVNKGEIPGNGIDDDENGYVDDIHGASTIGSTYDHTGDPMDDHAHGTHVAGIIAASNNKEGIVGVAYNAKIMAVKAGQGSGIFLQSDIAEAILYAYENGADVINMSFGGTACSIAVQDALSVAYTRSTLVAAAGNSGMPNQPTDYYPALPSYPGALSYVIGVMSVNSQGIESGFTNWDVYGFNTVEYEMYAPGEGIMSTLPGGNYGKLSGTSMAAPIVSGAAALLRSYFSDRDMYPSKFIAAQLCATSEITAICCNPAKHVINGMPHNIPMILNVSDALTKLPKPDVNLYDYYLYDSTVHEGNNGDGVIDAGETVDIGVVLRNRWGMSKDTVVTINATNKFGVDNPYVEFITDTANFDGVGTYSTKSTLIYDEDNIIIGCENPLTVRIKDNCPNDYLIELFVTVTFGNGLDEEDKGTYVTESVIQFWVRNGVVLPSQITEDMTLTKDNYYIIPNSTYIRPGVTVTVEPGTQIQFWSDDPNDPYAPTYIAMLNVEGNFITQGTVEEPVKLFPSQMMDAYRVEINEVGEGHVDLNYTTVTNPYLDITTADHCTFNQTYVSTLAYRYLDGGIVRNSYQYARIYAEQTTNSLIYKCGSVGGDYYTIRLAGDFDTCAFVDSAVSLKSEYSSSYKNNFVNCVFAGNHATSENGATNPTSSENLLKKQFCLTINSIKRDVNTGVTRVILGRYIEHDTQAPSKQAAEDLAKQMGGTLVSITGNSQDYETCFITIDIQGSIYCDTILPDEYAVSIDTESSYRVRPTVIPATFDTKDLIYVSEDPTVATVDENGLVTPLREGKTRVFVYSPDYLASTYVEISVVPKVVLTGLSLETTQGALTAGDSVALKPVLTPANTTERSLTYVSADPAVATVSDDGVITAHAVGTTTITVTGTHGLTATYTVKVVAYAESIDFAETFFVTFVGDTSEDWRPIVTPADATDISIAYASSNPEVAYVDKNGDLIRVSEGNATIRATLEGTDLYDEVVVSITSADEVVNAKIKKIEQFNYTTYALTEDGVLYLWGNNHRLPTKLCEGVKDFTAPISNGYTSNANTIRYGKLYILYEDGRLTQNDLYTKQDGLPCADLIETGVSPVRNAVSIEGESGSGSCYALTGDGVVWAWGDNRYGELGDGSQNEAGFAAPVQMDIENVVQVLSLQMSAVLLTENGDLYIVGTTNYFFAPHKVDSQVIRMTRYYYSGIHYTTTDGRFMELGDNNFYVSNVNVKYPIYGYGGYFIPNNISSWICMSEGIVYVYNDGFYYSVPGLTNVVNVFYRNSSVYMVTEDGKLYAFGENSHGELANLGNTDTYYDTPNRIFFGIDAAVKTPAMEDSNIIRTEIVPDGDEPAGPTLPDPIPWDEKASVVTHVSFDQLFTGLDRDASHNQFFNPGAADSWDGMAAFEDGSASVVTAWGWIGIKGDIGSFGYRIDHGTCVMDPLYTVEAEPGVMSIAQSSYGADTASRFMVSLDVENLGGEHTVEIIYQDPYGNLFILYTFTLKMPGEYTDPNTGIRILNTLTDRELVLDFDTALLKGTNYGKITLTNSQGTSMALKKDVFLDKLTITPLSGFVHGETYVLSIPTGAFTDIFGNNTEYIRIRFTYSDPTPIKQLSSTLTDGHVQSNQDFTASFDFTLANKGENFGQIAILKDGVAVEGVSVILDNDKLTLSGTLDYGTYKLIIPAGALCDNVGGVNQAVSYSFSIIEALELVSSSVSNGDRYVSVSDALVLNFTNAQMGDAYGDITLTSADGTPVVISKMLVNNTLTISHKGLAGDTTYMLTIPAGALVDEVGTPNAVITISFTTYAPVTLLYGSARDHAAVALNPLISLTYNGFAAVNGELITLVDENGNTIALKVLTTEGNDTLIGLRPETALTPDTTYTLTLGEGALVDLNGALSADETMTFKTIKQEARHFVDEDDVNAAMDAWIEAGENNPGFHNNAILNNFNDTNVEHWLRMTAGEYKAGSEYVPSIGISGNWWGTTNKELIERQILDFDDYNTLADINVGNYLTTAPENTFPFVSAVYLLNADGERVQVVSNETVTFVVEFNRDMDTSVPLTVRFGSSKPYGEYEIPGEYVTARRWEGTYTLKTTIENGRQYFNIFNGCAADDPYLVLCESPARWGFEIDTSSAQAMIMQGTATDTGILLNWAQDDYDTLLGYNVYRSDREDGLYVRLNDYVLPMEETTFFDDTVEPGKLYYYNFTVVLTDLSESTPSGKITIMSMDTMAPNIYHSPVRTAYTDSALMISATVTDNLGLRTVTLYYRAVGETTWRSTEMTAVNSRYTGRISAEYLTTDGLEYYIAATDGISVTYKGTADAPFTVTVQMAVDATALGDVDGDGRITNKDALMLLQAANDLLNLTEDQFMRADINGDGELSASEALRILQYVSGKVTTIVG